MELIKTSQKPKMVAIVGGTCSGKTWLAARLQEKLGQLASRLSQDNFYLDRSHLPLKRREKLNFDHPRAIDWKALEHVADTCKVGKESQIPTYDFATHSRLPASTRWTPKRVVIMEGLWLLRRRSLRRAFDLTLFLDCPKDLSRKRRLKRDQSERGRSAEAVEEQLKQTVFPMHERFVAPQARWAQVVLNKPVGEKDVEALAQKIKQLVSF
jgi:uridine kinase